MEVNEVATSTEKFNEDTYFTVVSLRKTWFGKWVRSEYALDYNTSLDGQKIVEGGYIGFKNKSFAINFMNLLGNKYSTRIKFIGK